MTRIHIFAGNADQARNLSRTMDLGRHEWSYVSTPQTLMGLKGGILMAFGTWHERPDSQEIIDFAITRQMTILYTHL